MFVAESLALAILQLPIDLDFHTFAVMDQGTNLTVQRLLDRGLTPTIDFGYQYGLLTLLIGRSWFALLGRTPEAYAAAMLVIDLLIAWGLARCAFALRAGPVGIALIVFTMLGTTFGSYINLAHACEATLICHALAEHASGRRSRALALLTACLFVKPVMAYLYGFLIVLLIVRRDGVPGLTRSVVGAALTGATLLLGVTAWFGMEAVFHTLLPLRGAESYKMLNYGFFSGVGRRFWLPDQVRPRYYVFSPAGHYLVGSVVLLAAAGDSIRRLVQRRTVVDDPGVELIACCGVMHLCFLTLFYGDFASWTYYYYILIIGLVAVAARGRGWAIVVGVVALAALAGYKDWGGHIKQEWRSKTRGTDTFGLWADGDCRDEWRQIKQIIGDSPTSFVAYNGGCLETFMPQLGDSENLFLIPGCPTQVELRRKLQQIAGAKFVVIKAMANVKPFLDIWPQFREALESFELATATKRFLIYRRLHSPPTHETETNAGKSGVAPGLSKARGK
jgi:hypothetical protein